MQKKRQGGHNPHQKALMTKRNQVFSAAAGSLASLPSSSEVEITSNHAVQQETKAKGRHQS